MFSFILDKCKGVRLLGDDIKNSQTQHSGNKQPKKHWAKDENRHSSKEDILKMSILNKHMKIYSISLVTKEMQFKVVYELKVKKKN